MRLIVIGASGLIGSAVMAAARSSGHEVIGTYSTRPREGLVPFNMKDDLLALIPGLGESDCVLLLAAMIDQEWVRTHPEESHAVNFLHAAKISIEVLLSGAHFIFMSSEAVFDGVPYGCDESRTPNPISLYAQQKAKVESCLPRSACIVRTGSVVGWRPEDSTDTVSKTYRTLLQPGARMAYDNVFTLTSVDDVALGLLHVVEQRFRGIVHLSATPPMSRTQLADLIIKQSRFGDQMAYERVSSKGRGWLSSVLDPSAAFAHPFSVVERKVTALDSLE